MRYTIGSRWTTQSRSYAGGWRQNPWINAMCSALRAQREARGSSIASIATDRAAVRTWENEGGSLAPHPSSRQ